MKIQRSRAKRIKKSERNEAERGRRRGRERRGLLKYRKMMRKAMLFQQGNQYLRQHIWRTRRRNKHEGKSNYENKDRYNVMHKDLKEHYCYRSQVSIGPNVGGRDIGNRFDDPGAGYECHHQQGTNTANQDASSRISCLGYYIDSYQCQNKEQWIKSTIARSPQFPGESSNRVELVGHLAKY